MAGESSDGFAEVGPRNHESFLNAVAVFVKSGCFELVFGSPEQQLKFLRFVEAIGDEANLLFFQLRYQIRYSKPRSLQLLLYFHNFFNSSHFGHLFMGYEAVVVPFLQPQ